MVKLPPARLSAYASRDDYYRIQAEITVADSLDALDILMNEERPIIEKFPESWEECIDAEAKNRRDELNEQLRENYYASTNTSKR